MTINGKIPSLGSDSQKWKVFQELERIPILGNVPNPGVSQFSVISESSEYPGNPGNGKSLNRLQIRKSENFKNFFFKKSKLPLGFFKIEF